MSTRSDAIPCALCQHALIYVHGHGACANNRCPMFGQNQAECCTGESADQCVATTAQVARVFTRRR